MFALTSRLASSCGNVTSYVIGVDTRMIRGVARRVPAVLLVLKEVPGFVLCLCAFVSETAGLQR